MTRSPFPRPRALLVAAVLLGLVLGAVSVAPAQAAPAAPTGLTPNGVGVTGIPTLSWGRVTGAAGYSVEVATSSTFGSVVWRIDTANRFAVPTVHMPNTVDGAIHWRVRAYGDSGQSAWTTGAFARSPLAGPAPVSPPDAAVLVEPTDPALLSWAPVVGATDYKVEVDTESAFIDPSTYNTRTTSVLVPEPAIATTYFWRVTAILSSGSVSEPSVPQRFQISGLTKPVLVAPVDDVDVPVPDGDVVLEWKPVPGAARYNVQVSTDINFQNNAETRQTNGVTGTRYSPPVTYGNDQYYWRVQPVDTAGHLLDWSAVDVWHFQRNWPDQPVLEHPEDRSATVGRPGNGMFYQWTPVPHAAWYRLQLSTTSTFNTIYKSCDTRQTTYVPTDNDCVPESLETVYWRVIAYDDDCSLSCAEIPHTDGIVSQTRRFTYDSGVVDQTAPAPGEVVAADRVPVLTWTAAANTSRYRVTITNVVNGWTYERDTVALAMVPRLRLDPGTYRWQVRTISEFGKVGPSLFESSQPTFTIAGAFAPAATYAAPTPTTGFTTGKRMPVMSWTPVTGATYYRLYARSQGTQAWYELNATYDYPGAVYEDIRASGFDLLGPDTYEWLVKAYNSAGFISDSGASTGTYQITALPSAVDERAALTGTALGADATSCRAALPVKCLDLRQTPVLGWSAVGGAGYYQVYLSRDKEMTNVIGYYPTGQNMWTPKDLLPDSQAGAAYYWTVKSCVTAQACSPLEHAGQAFNKLSNAVELTSETTRDAITFRWRDYLATNSDAQVASHLDSTGVPSRQEAARYQVQVSTVPNFETTVDDAIVDQMTYTSFAKTYPEGPLYWRVRAIDGSNNPLTWSAARPFAKSSDHPRLASPTGDTVVGGTQPFRWAPMDYASSYDIEVYRGADTIGQPANLVFSGNSRQVAFTRTTPLPPGRYSWRVRRIDSGNLVGRWSPLDPAELAGGESRGMFQVSGATPVQGAPALGATVPANQAVFTWQATPGAALYRWRRREPATGNVVASVDTSALAWAAPDVLPAGSWQWSVTALDASGQELGSSSWRGFTVGAPSTGGSGGTAPDRTRPRVSAFKPASGARVKRSSTFTVVFSERVTRVSRTTLKLLLNGSGIRVSVTLAGDGRTAVLRPRTRLRARTTYVVTASSGIRDRAGNALVAASATYRTRAT